MKPHNALSYLVWFLIVAPVGTDRVFDLAGAPGWFTVIVQVICVVSLLLTYVPMILARQQPRRLEGEAAQKWLSDWREGV